MKKTPLTNKFSFWYRISEDLYQTSGKQPIDKKEYEKIMAQREKVELEYADCGLEGKKLTRKIDDNTFINFADLILNNLKDAEDNIRKIRASLALLKDGQAVFTNLEKLYVYRYVFCKGTEHKNKIKITDSKINDESNKETKEIDNDNKNQNNQTANKLNIANDNTNEIIKKEL